MRKNKEKHEEQSIIAGFDIKLDKECQTVDADITSRIKNLHILIVFTIFLLFLL